MTQLQTPTNEVSASAASTWILGGLHWDLLAFIVPGFIALLLSVSADLWSPATAISIILLATLVDSSHIGITVWRTWLYEPERQRSKLFYYSLPAAIFILALLIQQWSVSVLFSILTYGVLFHQMRQNYGVYRWYEFLNGSQRKRSRWFLTLVMALPVLIAHTPEISMGGIFTSTSFYKFSTDLLILPLIVAYILVVGAWLFDEYRLWKSGARELNRFLAIATPAVLYGAVFLRPGTWEGQMVALIVAHAFQYMALTGLSVVRSQSNRFATPEKVVTLFLAASVVTILLFWGLTEVGQIFVVDGSASSPLAAICRALFVTIALCHYIVDGFIWKRKHWESGLVYTRP